jgi:two-component system response regulator DesR
VIRVLIAEDMHLIRGALVALLSRELDMEVVAELERGDQVLEAAIRTRPDVAVLDIDLPGMDGLSAAEALNENFRAVRSSCSQGSASPVTCSAPSRSTCAASS